MPSESRSQELQSYSPEQIMQLVRSGEMKPEIVIKAFPDNEQIVGAIYDFLSQQDYSSQAGIIKSIHEGKITPDVAVQSYPDNVDIVQVAYLKSPESIRFAQKECINQLGSKGVISKEDVLKIFNMTEMTIEVKEQISREYTRAFLAHDWSTVARISQMFWFEKPEGVTYQSIINDIYINFGMKEFYAFEQAFNQEQIDITYGPLPKDIETIQLEMLMRKFLVNERYEIETRPDGDYFVFPDGEAFNWTKIRAGANLQHVQLNEEDMLAYRQINTISTDTTSFLLPEKEEEYRNQLYQYYDEHHIPRPDPLISFSEMQAINIYTGGFYEKMNGLMRDDPKKFDYRNSSEQNKSLTRLALINSVMCASGLRKIPETNIPVSYRGAKIRDKEEFSEQVRAAHHHGVVELSGFISTSINQSRAFGHKAVHYTFHNLRGAYIAPISKVEAISPEQEFLIPQTQVRLTHYEYKNGKHHFDATLVEDLSYSQKKKFKRLIDFSSLKFTDTIILIKLIRESKIQAIDMIPFFKNDNEIIMECFKKTPAIITYVEKEKVLELLKSGDIQANLVINFFQKDKDIILACYQQDKNSITYGDLNKIFELYVDGLIDEVDLMKLLNQETCIALLFSLTSEKGNEAKINFVFNKMSDHLFSEVIQGVLKKQPPFTDEQFQRLCTTNITSKVSKLTENPKEFGAHKDTLTFIIIIERYIKNLEQDIKNHKNLQYGIPIHDDFTKLTQEKIRIMNEGLNRISTGGIQSALEYLEADLQQKTLSKNRNPTWVKLAQAIFTVGTVYLYRMVKSMLGYPVTQAQSQLGLFRKNSDSFQSTPSPKPKP